MTVDYEFVNFFSSVPAPVTVTCCKQSWLTVQCHQQLVTVTHGWQHPFWDETCSQWKECDRQSNREKWTKLWHYIPCFLEFPTALWKPMSLIPKGCLPEQVKEENQPNPGLPGNRPLKTDALHNTTHAKHSTKVQQNHKIRVHHIKLIRQ